MCVVLVPTTPFHMFVFTHTVTTHLWLSACAAPACAVELRSRGTARGTSALETEQVPHLTPGLETVESCPLAATP